jgi:hypothetical protein
MPYRSVTPNINVNTASGQLRTELMNSFIRLDSQLGSVPITLTSQTGPASNTGTGETVLFSQVFDTTTWPVNSDSIAFTFCGNTAANTNAKDIRLYYGGTLIFDTGSNTFNGISWVLKGEIIRNGATSQICYAEIVTSDSTYKSSATQTLTNKNLANNQSLILTGQGISTGDVSAYYFKVLLNSH